MMNPHRGIGLRSGFESGPLHQICWQFAGVSLFTMPFELGPQLGRCKFGKCWRRFQLQGRKGTLSKTLRCRNPRRYRQQRFWKMLPLCTLVMHPAAISTRPKLSEATRWSKLHV
ncbi:hypothetical protein BT63DRAFT_304465 [Microthyrium microscopicum]|uniref:Uncharacterized protein n=1 Tax=Microthyrium microscopicum TaxID=703497 RepID=A0A6A6U8G6_9PEZI|nr:hypothetical protein BT63DRAFT_304465 [Microthyrium microscopicum]